MISWINVVVLIVATVLILYFEVKSAVPVALEKKIGAIAHTRCTRYRVIASLLMTLAGINYVIYAIYPLPLPLPQTFPWSWWVSAAIAILFAILAGYLWWREMDEAGEEKFSTDKTHRGYEDIYEKNQHPQVASELPFWWMIAFLLDSPFLVLFSFIWVPIFEIASWLEQEDLLIRDEGQNKRENSLIPKQV